MNKFNNKGMTLSEMLVATIIMLLVSVGLSTGVALANKEFISSIKQSEAQELYSTLSTIISNELRYTSEIYSSDNKTQDEITVSGFYSMTYSPSDKNTNPYLLILTKDGSTTSSDFGQLAIGQGTNYNRVLNSASYPNNLGVRITVKYNQTKALFTVYLDVGTIGGDAIISNEPFSVRALKSDKLSIK